MMSKVLVGEFVNLRPLSASDAEITFAWRVSDRAKFLNKASGSVDTQRAWIDSRPASEYNFIIELKNGVRVGMLSLIQIDLLNRHAEPGRFLIGDDDACHGLPVAVEAMKLLYQLAFVELGLVRVYGIVAANNRLMVKWQKFFGMKEEGVLRNHLWQNNNFQDAVFLGLLVDDYNKITLPRMISMITAARPPQKILNSRDLQC